MTRKKSIGVTGEGRTQPLMSVLIPCYEMGGLGAEMLGRALSSLLSQRTDGRFQVEVVVSDQSRSDELERLVGRIEPPDGIVLRYLRNRVSRQSSSANLNYAFKNATGEYTKILFQDDFLTVDNALSLIHTALQKSSSPWLVCGSSKSRNGVTLEETMVPRYHEEISLGHNTISSPSVLALKSEAWLEFDENLIWLMDCELYGRLGKKYGPPTVLVENLVANGVGRHQLTESGVSDLRKKIEFFFVKLKRFAGSMKVMGDGVPLSSQ